MALTIPKAGTIGGQSASTAAAVGQIVGAGAEAAGVMAEFGNRMLEKGLQWKAAQREQAVRKLQLDMTRDMGMAKLEAEQITDPTQVGPFWDAKTAELNAKYVDGQEDPEIRSAMGMAVQGSADQHAVDLAGKVVTLERSQKEADWITARGQIVLDTTRADPTTLDAMLGQGDAWIDSLVTQGILDPAQAATEKEALHQEVWANRARAAIQDDPDAFLAAAARGEWDGMGGTPLATSMVAAKGESDRRAARVASDQEKILDARLSDMTSLFQAGEPVANKAFLETPEAKSRPGWAPAMAAMALAEEFPGFKKLPLSEQNRIIAAEAARPKTHDWEAKRGEVLRAWRDQAAKDWTNDPGQAAKNAGLEYTELPDFDPSDPEAFTAGLKGRIRDDQFFADNGYTKNVSAVLTKDDKTALKTVIDRAAPAGPKVALAGSILAATDGLPEEVLAVLGGDLEFNRAVKVLGLTGDTALTEAILRGGQKIEGKTVILPPHKEQVLIFDAMTGGMFSDAPEVKKELMAAVLALYADGADSIDGETTAAEGWISDGAAYTLYGQSLQRLLGAQPDRNGKLTIGGIQELNGSLVALPPGVSVQDAERGWEDLSHRLAGSVWDTSRGQGEWISAAPEGFDAPEARLKVAPGDEARFAPFMAASLFGGIPDLGKDPAARMATLTPQRIGESDVYRLVYDDGSGRPVIVPQAGTDHEYLFRLSDLLQGAKQ